MDFESAAAIAPLVEQTYPELIVSGMRRTSHSRPFDSWALDVVSKRTGRMVTLDEKDDWEASLRPLLKSDSLRQIT